MDDVRWLEGADGVRIGVVVLGSGVRLLLPDGSSKVITAEETPRVLSMLQQGIDFLEITGHRRVNFEEREEHRQ